MFDEENYEVTLAGRGCSAVGVKVLRGGLFIRNKWTRLPAQVVEPFAGVIKSGTPPFVSEPRAVATGSVTQPTKNRAPLVGLSSVVDPVATARGSDTACRDSHF